MVTLIFGEIYIQKVEIPVSNSLQKVTRPITHLGEARSGTPAEVRAPVGVRVPRRELSFLQGLRPPQRLGSLTGVRASRTHHCKLYEQKYFLYELPVHP